MKVVDSAGGWPECLRVMVSTRKTACLPAVQLVKRAWLAIRAGLWRGSETF